MRKARQNVAPQVVPCAEGIGVGRVADERDPEFRERPPDQVRRNVEDRADHVVADHGDPRSALGAAAAQKPEQYRFRRVVAVVRRRDIPKAGEFRQALPQGVVAQTARRRLDALSRRHTSCGHVDRNHLAGHAESFQRGKAERRVVFCLLPADAVFDVQGGEGKTDLLAQRDQNPEQKRRIRPARVGDEDPVTLRKTDARAFKQTLRPLREGNEGRRGIHYPALPVPAVLVFSAGMNLVN